MLQETESQASNTTPRNIQELGEEEANESKRDHKRPSGRSKSNGTINANKEWSDEEIFQLIDAWREIYQLYNVKHPTYHLKDERSKNPRLLAEKLLEKMQKLPFHKSVKRCYNLKIISLAKRGRSRCHPKNLVLVHQMFTIVNSSSTVTPTYQNKFNKEFQQYKC